MEEADMTKEERIFRMLNLQEVDCVPLLGVYLVRWKQAPKPPQAGGG